MNSLCVIVEFNVLEYLLPSLFGVVITGILNKLSFYGSPSIVGVSSRLRETKGAVSESEQLP